MKKVLVPMLGASLLLGSVAATVWAAEGSPFGKFGEYDKVEIVVEKNQVVEKGAIIDGKLYVPIDVLRDRNKAAYYYDPEKYQAYLFFGGGGSSTVNDSSSGNNSTSANKLTVKSALTSGLMSGIPYEADDYHSGMMRQDIINLGTLARALMDTSKDMDTVVYAKLNFNKDPDINLLQQRLIYRSMPFEVMEDRMYALADELGRQIGSSEKRRMKDIIDDIDEAVRKKEKAIDALKDWIRSSDEDDLDDFRDYEEDARETLVEVIKKLTGDNFDKNDKNPQRYENNLLDEVEDWSSRLRK
ncbi:hypothetical protein [Brevibacillus sp. SYSU BS000544]|uniref:hypothetical protein n=1 Tax=Brevibacillus sp. SYSU BS000544 TaxID=3416443 RepID=UPI003CE58965